ncbi:restriction endonuclease subunit S [Iodobacter sp. LRB]|uniref:restriction endonuclease subunit S n=1 Tax=unclassified Iodobacter TaxID=235634 RepID=UPI000C120256|nr:restriction endonuclease subunit S [Iodobacter sp. BJB302]PHV01515.1 restriction endonuclease [Iodobacter sp. BJB302]
MSEWIEAPLSQLVVFQKGRKVDTSAFIGEGFAAYLGASGIEGRNDGYAATQFAVLAKPTDILMLWDGERSGLVGFGKLGVVASTVTKLTPKDQIDPQYLFFALSDRYSWIQHRRTGTGVPHVPKDLGRILNLRYPKGIAVQKKIATILSCIDTAIEKTEALIAKYQQIKAGLMHDLFTRGVLPNGQLRPPREQAPELYQVTAIGWVPREWEIVHMIELAEDKKGSTTIGPFGSDLLASDYQIEGVPIVFVRDIKESGFEWNSETYVSEKKAIQLNAHRIKAGDVLATKMGLPPCISCLYPKTMPNAVMTADIIRLSPDRNKVAANWLASAINQDRVKRQVAGITAGVTRLKVTLADFRGIKVAKPELWEQELISQRLEAVQTMIDTENARVALLCNQKLGLMQDLLTGKVPVKIDDVAIEATHG